MHGTDNHMKKQMKIVKDRQKPPAGNLQKWAGVFIKMKDMRFGVLQVPIPFDVSKVGMFFVNAKENLLFL